MLQKSACKVLGLFLYIFILYFIGSLIFTKGFLLKRDVVEQNSGCRVDFARYWDGEGHGAEGCWLHRRFDKAVIILIDALRFDFIAPSTGTDKPYLNNFKYVHKLLNESPQHAQLYRFTADPPTTTLQRLKGLTTGSLPTFVDAGSNFASTEISEDNIIDQIKTSGRKITFMGDDTWKSLFPRQFNREYSFPSFNVKDLHTVDNGVLNVIYNEVKNKDWDVLIAHFLGVDHCGHRFGPNHVAMQEKLQQMNEMLRNVSELIDKDTVLFVLGDHGMTETGDHGGDSFDEVDAGLFIYSKSQLSSVKKPQDTYKEVSQIDIVPTLSLLLGLPVPFSNLGTVITDLFGYCTWSKDSHIKEVYHIVEALRLNAQQISSYINHYMSTSSDLPAHKIMALQTRLQNAENTLQRLVTDMFVNNKIDNAHETLHYLEKEYVTYMQQVKELCKEVWAKFDLIAMGLGILMFGITILVNVYLFYMLDSLSQDKWGGSNMIVLGLSLIFVIFCAFHSFYMEVKSMTIMAFILGIVDLIALGIIIQITRSNLEDPQSQSLLNKMGIKVKKFTLDHIFSCAIVLITVLCYFSNSFVVFEDDITLFLVQSSIWYFCVKIIYNILKDNKNLREISKSKHKSMKNQEFRRLIFQSVLPTVVLSSLCCLCIRLSSNFRTQREEQLAASPLSADQASSTTQESLMQDRNVQFFLQAGCLLCSLYMPRKWLATSGNLNGVTGTVLCARYLVPTSGVFTVLYWALQCLDQKVLDSLPVWQQVVLPQTAYVLIALSGVSFIVWPLCVYMLPKQGKQLSVSSDGADKDLISKLYDYIKQDWNADFTENSKDQGEIPRVFGLGTVFTSALLYNGTILLLLLALLLGGGMSTSILTAVSAIFCFLELFTVAVKICRDSDLLLLGIVTWSLLTNNYFYGFGHQATIPAIRFEAAFVGFHGDWENKLLPALMIHCNMFAAELLFSYLMPLLILYPCTRGIFTGYILPRRESEGGWQGDFVMHNNQTLFRQLLIKLMAVVFLVNGSKLGGSMLAASVHRRHLMVWKIFAPRFVYQAMSTFSVLAASLLGLATVFRVEKSLDKWITKLK